MMDGRPYSDVDDKLLRLAAVLDAPLRIRLLALIQADSRAGRVVELEQKAQRAEDLVAEIRRHLEAALQRDDRFHRALEAPDVTVDQLRAEFCVRARDRGEFAASSTREGS